jgi:hypothetical protein
MAAKGGHWKTGQFTPAKGHERVEDVPSRAPAAAEHPAAAAPAPEKTPAAPRPRPQKGVLDPRAVEERTYRTDRAAMHAWNSLQKKKAKLDKEGDRLWRPHARARFHAESPDSSPEERAAAEATLASIRERAAALNKRLFVINRKLQELEGYGKKPAAEGYKGLKATEKGIARMRRAKENLEALKTARAERLRSWYARRQSVGQTPAQSRERMDRARMKLMESGKARSLTRGMSKAQKIDAMAGEYRKLLERTHSPKQSELDAIVKTFGRGLSRREINVARHRATDALGPRGAGSQ